jgi:hypothetical protein
VLPHAQYVPTLFVQASIRVRVTSPVASDLVSPERGVCASRRPVVVRAPVPEAPVEEHGDPYLGEDQIGGSANLLDRPDTYSITETKRVNGGSQREFGSGVAAFVPTHDRSSGGARRPGVSHAYHYVPVVEELGFVKLAR